MILPRVIAIGLLGVLPCTGGTVPLDDFALRIGGFASRLDTSIRLYETDYYQTAVIDFDDELALDEESVVEVIGISARPWPRHQFEFNYFDQSLAGDRQLRREIEFEGETFEVDSIVRSRVSMRAIEFGYTGWIWLEEDWALGLRFSYMDYELLASMALLLGAQGEEPQVMAEARLKEHVPVPSFGIDFRVQVAEHWRMKFRVGWLEKTLESVSPRVAAVHTGIEFTPWEHFGAWIELGMNRLDVDGRREDFNGGLRFDEGGVRIGATWRY